MGAGKSIMRTPPPGSQFARYVNEFDAMLSDGNPLWQSEVWEERLCDAVGLLTEKPLHEVPFSIVREFIVVPDMVEAGMPAAIPEWAEVLLDDRTHRLQYAARAETRRKARLPSKNKGGHPPTRNVPFMVVVGSYLRAERQMPEASDNYLFERVAEKLGPGIGRGAVRREVLSFRQALASDTAWAKIVPLAMNVVAEMLDKVDAARAD